LVTMSQTILGWWTGCVSSPVDFSDKVTSALCW
jgi:hypothetical protein